MLCRPMQPRRAQPSRMEIVHVCTSGMAGLGGLTSIIEIVQGRADLGGSWPGGDHEYLWIPSLKGSSEGDHTSLRCGSLGSTALAGQRSRAGGSDIPLHAEQLLHTGLLGGV
jgi:hypothetical protein